MTLLEVSEMAARVKAQISELEDCVDVAEQVAKLAKGDEIIDRVYDDLSILRRDVERIVEMLRERRGRLSQLDRAFVDG